MLEENKILARKLKTRHVAFLKYKSRYSTVKRTRDAVP